MWAQSLSHVCLFATPWTVAFQAALSMEFSRQEYWSGFHVLLQGIFQIQGSNPHLLLLLLWQAGSLPLVPHEKSQMQTFWPNDPSAEIQLLEFHLPRYIQRNSKLLKYCIPNTKENYSFVQVAIMFPV